MLADLQVIKKPQFLFCILCLKKKPISNSSNNKNPTKKKNPQKQTKKPEQIYEKRKFIVNILTTLLIFCDFPLPSLYHMVCSNGAYQYDGSISMIEKCYKGKEKDCLPVSEDYRVAGKSSLDRDFHKRNPFAVAATP